MNFFFYYHSLPKIVFNVFLTFHYNQFADMIMQQLVGWSGQLTLWHIDVVHVESPLACPSVLSVFRKGTMMVMTSICSEARQEVLVTVVTHLS